MRLVEIADEEFHFELQMATSDDYCAVIEQHYVYLGHGDYEIDDDFSEEVVRWTWENCRSRASFQEHGRAVRFVLLADAIHFKLRWS